MRWIVNMDNKDSLDLIKMFLNEGIQIRHLKYMSPNEFWCVKQGRGGNNRKEGRL